MKLKIYAHNILDGLSDPGRSSEYVQAIKQLAPDIVLFTEAYKAQNEDTLTPVQTSLAALGYTISCSRYDDLDGRKDNHGIFLAVRLELLSPNKPPHIVRIGQRNIIECRLVDQQTNQSIHFVGMHLNDRSENKRQAELHDLLNLIDSKEPTILAGDLNSLHKSDARGNVFRKAKLIHTLVKIKLMPTSDPKGEQEPNSMARKGSLNFRLHEMASGETIKRLEAAGFTDADTAHRPTYPAAKPFAQLDHILTSPQLRTAEFIVLPEGTSDHLGIIANISI